MASLARVFLLSTVLTVATTAPALAARAPGVATDGSSEVSQTSARVAGRVNPRDVQTTYVFEYGPTKAYGLATPPTDVGKGTKGVPVTADLTGLAPATTYHYRIVATSGAGTARGGDRAFVTQKQPLGLSLAATPNPVPYGSGATLSGTLTGTDRANRAVALEQNAFPFTAGFTPLGNPLVTSPEGAFAFPVLALTATTQYRVQVVGRPAASPIVTAVVALRVGTNVSRTRVRRGLRIRFTGTVTPARVGALVAVQKLRGTTWITVGGSVVTSARNGRSRYGVTVKIPRGGSYRVLAATSGDLAGSVGRTVRIASYR